MNLKKLRKSLKEKPEPTAFKAQEKITLTGAEEVLLFAAMKGY